MALDPASASNVGNRAPIADKVSRCRLLEVGVHGGVKSSRLILVAVDAVLYLLRCITFAGKQVSTEAVLEPLYSRLKWFACLPSICQLRSWSCLRRLYKQLTPASALGHPFAT